MSRSRPGLALRDPDSPLRRRIAPGRDPRAWDPSASPKRELAVVPMYWFAFSRHFDEVTTLP